MVDSDLSFAMKCFYYGRDHVYDFHNLDVDTDEKNEM